jgi:hypothetical protein
MVTCKHYLYHNDGDKDNDNDDNDDTGGDDYDHDDDDRANSNSGYYFTLDVLHVGNIHFFSVISSMFQRVSRQVNT